MSDPAADVTIRAVEPDDWPLIEALFGPRGAVGGCWCMWPRIPRGGKLFESCKGEPNRLAMKALVEGGQAQALLALENGQPAGWCCFGPRADFPRLDRVRALKRDWGPGTWSIVCFYMPAKRRRQGIAGRLLARATAEAFARGARVIEGYPVAPREPGATYPAAFAWMGVEALFRRAGYRPCEPLPGQTRRVWIKQPQA